MKQDISKERKQIFFAYQGPDGESYNNNVEAIRKGCSEYNKYQSKYYAKVWEEMKTDGMLIDKKILNEIDASEVFACDLSLLNDNVIFELGYAIAKCKRIKVFLNKDIKGSIEDYENFLFPNLGYTSFTNYDDIRKALNDHKDDNDKSDIKEDIRKSKSLSIIRDIFYLPNSNNTQAGVELDSFMLALNTDKYERVIIEDKREVEYQTLKYYIDRIATSQSLIIHMASLAQTGSREDNLKKSFWAGMGCALDRKVLLLAPAKFKTPLDYHDITIQYTDSEKCIESTRKWIEEYLRQSSEIEQYKNEEVKAKKEDSLDILTLALECVAENERSMLSSYFIEISPYNAASNNKSKIILKGRKGVGKTAIYYKLLEEFQSNNQNYIISLKPDSEELLENLSLSSMYSVKSSFFATVWRTVIYSKLIYSLYEKNNEKKNNGMMLNSEEEGIMKFVEDNKQYMNKNFYGIIQTISTFPKDQPNILEYLYDNYLKSAINIINNFFHDKKYSKLIIMADNLDKMWNEKTDLKLQSEMILSILEVDNKIKKELKNTDLSILSFIFLREDIYNFIFKNANEPDKLKTFTYSIDWAQYEDKLKELVEKRFQYVLKKQVNNIWDEYFSFGKKDPFVEIKRRIILRPRDILYFISKLFESASDNYHKKADIKDLKYATREYTAFLNGNLIAEIKAEFPQIADILEDLQHFQTQKYSKIKSIIKDHLYDDDKVDILITLLFEQGYLSAVSTRHYNFFTSHQEVKDYLKKRQKLSIFEKIKNLIKSDRVLVFINSTYSNRMY